MWLLPLGIGTTEAVFQTVGNLPEEIDWFISLAIPEAVLVFVAFSIVADVPSDPLDFVVSNDRSISSTSSSVIR